MTGIRKVEDAEAIWLEPKCAAESHEGRHWCSDPIPDCEDCGDKAVKYVLARPSPSLDEETIEAAAKSNKHLAQEFGRSIKHLIDDTSFVENYVESLLDAKDRALKSTPNQQVGRGELASDGQVIQAILRAMDTIPNDMSSAYHAERIAEALLQKFTIVRGVAPAVSGEGWMKDAAKEIYERAEEVLYDTHVFDGTQDFIELASGIIARHFPSPEGADDGKSYRTPDGRTVWLQPDGSWK